MEPDNLDRLLDTQEDEEFPAALGDRIMATLPSQDRYRVQPRAQVLAFGGSLAASLAIGISLGLSDIGQEYDYAENDVMELAFGLPEDSGENLDEEQ